MNNFAPEIAYLRKQVDEIESLSSDPERLKGVLLETCNGLLTLLTDFQDGPAQEVEADQEKTDADQQVVDQQTVDKQVVNQQTVDLQHIIQALERSQANLTLSEDRYRTIVESQAELICRFTPEGTLTFCNEAFRQYFSLFGEVEAGYNLLDIVPKDVHSFTYNFTAILHPALPVTQFEYRTITPDGIAHWQQWNGVGFFNQEGRLSEVQAVGHDITQRKQAEISAEQHNRELSALHTATAALLTTLDPEALLGRILDAALSAIPAARKGMIHLIAPDTGQLEMRASIGYNDPRIRRIRVLGSMGYVAKAVRERTPLLVNDMQADPSNINGSMPEAREVQSAIVAPLILNHQVLGAISLESTLVQAFNEIDLELFTSFADMATTAIHNARLHGEVQKLAITDALTGLYNRRGFFELGQREVERSRRFERPLVAIMMDVDRFKYINDFYGHAAGDRVLQVVAKRCLDNLRRIDILGRFGGDEFTLLLPETDIFRAKGVAERVRQCISSSPVGMDGTQIEVSVSLGIARATTATPDLEVLISRADAAMYIAKQSGRNRVEYG